MDVELRLYIPVYQFEFLQNRKFIKAYTAIVYILPAAYICVSVFRTFFLFRQICSGDPWWFCFGIIGEQVNVPRSNKSGAHT